MKLYLISQDENDGYDTYDSAVVCAGSEDEARKINPDYGEWGRNYGSWCSSPDKVTVRHIGEAVEGMEPGIVLASFHAG